jgi:hypothetical protein
VDEVVNGAESTVIIEIEIDVCCPSLATAAGYKYHGGQHYAATNANRCGKARLLSFSLSRLS